MNSNACEVGFNWGGHFQSKQTSLQFPLMQAYPALIGLTGSSQQGGEDTPLPVRQGALVSQFGHEYH